MSRLRLLLLALVAALAACSEPTTLRLSITAGSEVGALRGLRAIALVSGTSERSTFSADVTSRDLRTEPFVLEIDVSHGREENEAVVALLGDTSDGPTASAVVRVALSDTATHDVVLTPIGDGCDADRDGFKPCAAKAACCTALEAATATDCDDTEPRLSPFAEAAVCRACDAVATCLASEPDGVETPDTIEPNPEIQPDLPPDARPDAHDAHDTQADAIDVAEPAPDTADPSPDVADPDPAPDLVEPPPDVPIDLPPETTCDCSTGPCCDGCHYRSTDTVCAPAAATTTVCDGSGCGANVREIVSDRHCPGNGSSCTGNLVALPSALKQDCPAYKECSEAGGAHCVASDTCTELVCPSGMLVVPEGAFYMGCNATLDDQCDAKEKPQHPVAVPTFCIDTFEVPRADYAKCGACSTPGTGSDCVWGLDAQTYEGHPINCVTWEQAKAYCESRGTRLCSEAEWEKAARGGCDIVADGCAVNEPIYGWGNSCPSAWGHGCVDDPWDEGSAAANCAESLCYDGNAGTAPIDTFSSYPSPYLLASMSGNVAEWVADCYHASYDPNGDGLTDAPTDGSAWTSNCDSGRLTRGGSWGSSLSYYLRASARMVQPADNATAANGIRCCKSIP